MNDECPICIEPLNCNVCILRCNHSFHVECILQLNNNKCPMCRLPIKMNTIPTFRFEEQQILKNRYDEEKRIMMYERENKQRRDKNQRKKELIKIKNKNYKK